MSACLTGCGEKPAAGELCDKCAERWRASGEHRRYKVMPVSEPHRRLVALMDFANRTRAERNNGRTT